jgi:hypothetical protein
VTIENVDYDTISQDSDAMESLESDIVTTYLSYTSSSYSSSNFRCSYRKGSVIANVTILVVPGDDPDALLTTLATAKTDCESKVLTKVKNGKAKNYLESGKTVDDIKVRSSNPKKTRSKKTQDSTSAISGALRKSFVVGLLASVLVVSGA